jgi:hypothetical protein
MTRLVVTDNPWAARARIRHPSPSLGLTSMDLYQLVQVIYSSANRHYVYDNKGYEVL